MKIRFKVRHTHAGVVYHPGATTEVADHDATWLAERAIAETVREEAPKVEPKRRAFFSESE